MFLLLVRWEACGNSQEEESWVPDATKQERWEFYHLLMCVQILNDPQILNNSPIRSATTGGIGMWAVTNGP